MLRLYFLQQWYGLADEALEDALYDSQALRGFAGIDLARAAKKANTLSRVHCRLIEPLETDQDNNDPRLAF